MGISITNTANLKGDRFFIKTGKFERPDPPGEPTTLIFVFSDQGASDQSHHAINVGGLPSAKVKYRLAPDHQNGRGEAVLPWNYISNDLLGKIPTLSLRRLSPGERFPFRRSPFPGDFLVLNSKRQRTGLGENRPVLPLNTCAPGIAKQMDLNLNGGNFPESGGPGRKPPPPWFPNTEMAPDLSFSKTQIWAPGKKSSPI